MNVCSRFLLLNTLKNLSIHLLIFWLHWVFVAVHGLSLMAVSGGFSLMAVSGGVSLMAVSRDFSLIVGASLSWR